MGPAGVVSQAKPDLRAALAGVAVAAIHLPNLFSAVRRLNLDESSNSRRSFTPGRMSVVYAIPVGSLLAVCAFTDRKQEMEAQETVSVARPVVPDQHGIRPEIGVNHIRKTIAKYIRDGDSPGGLGQSRGKDCSRD